MDACRTAQIFLDLGEYFAAGFMELENASNARRYCRAYRRLYENCPMMDYPADSPVYPVRCIRDDGLAVSPQYCRQFSYDRKKMAGKSEEAARIFDAFCDEHERFWQVDGYERMSGYFAYLDAWNHSVPNFKRITEEGLNGYERRIRQMRDDDLREALLDVMAGIRAYHRRTLAYLTEVNADPRLIDALRRVPFEPVQTAYEAIVCANFVYCFDGCDNIGHAPAWLDRYWRGENLERAMHGMMKSLEDSEGWSLTVGPEYNELTEQWIRASHGLARPMVELRTAKDMPEELWRLALETVLSGGGQPSFYNEDAIIGRLRDRLPHVPKADICEFAGMGCTETSFSGMTFCGGIDANLDVLKVFEECMRKDLCGCTDFDGFYARFLDRLHGVQDEMMAFINAYYNRRAEISFAPVRTLFTDDCIEKETGYYQGGARYTFAIPADSGIPNTVDSLLAVKHLIFERGLYDAPSFLAALDGDDPAFRAALKTCPAYGVADPEADELMRDLTGRFYHRYRSGKLDLGLGFFPTSHQFIRHVTEGGIVGATPDGRRAGDALADSIAAVNGKAVHGPTSMLQSASCFDQREVYGVAVLNLSITKAFDPAVLRALIETYFELGGTQIQITCTTRETLLDAQANPDAHRDLVVRVGGYSYHFCRLTRELQDAVIARTVF